MPGMEVFSAEERKQASDVLATGALFRYNHEHIRKGMWKAKELEEAVCEFTKAKYAHAVSSGSAAVTAVLAAAGIGFGDEVIVPPFTYVAPIESVLLAGALPLFADIDESLCLSAEGIEKAITPRTKAVLLVHMCGAAANMDAIMAVCKKYNLLLVEDAGQALGAFHRGKSVGLFGKAGAFSFDYFKITTCGEGGVCITNNEKKYRLIAQMTDHGHSHIGDNRGMEAHPILGFNHRIGEINAAIGLAQMHKLVDIRTQKKANKTYLKERLSAFDGITFRNPIDVVGDSGTFLNFFTPNIKLTQKLVAQFAKDNIGGVAYWYTNMYHFINQWDHIKQLKFPAKLAIHHLGAPQNYTNLSLPRAQQVVGRLISLVISCTIKMSDVEAFTDKIAVAIKRVL